jgi:hypothetical protein
MSAQRAVFRAKFWHHFEFEFIDIFGYGTSQVRLGAICRYLLAQDDPVQNLQSKTEWMIHGPELFVLVLSSVPNFLTTLRKLQLRDRRGKDRHFALRRLRPCRDLELEIGGATRVPRPFVVSRIESEKPRAYIPQNTSRQLVRVGWTREVSIVFTSLQQRIPLDALPLGSANTLTSFGMDNFVDESFSLEDFTNLDVLEY